MLMMMMIMAMKQKIQCTNKFFPIVGIVVVIQKLYSTTTRQNVRKSCGDHQ